MTPERRVACRRSRRRRTSRRGDADRKAVESAEHAQRLEGVIRARLAYVDRCALHPETALHRRALWTPASATQRLVQSFPEKNA